MGFNTGLIVAAQSESELAGVMAHEIAHVTQKHLARMISAQRYSLLTSLAAVALAGPGLAYKSAGGGSCAGRLAGAADSVATGLHA